MKIQRKSNWRTEVGKTQARGLFKCFIRVSRWALNLFHAQRCEKPDQSRIESRSEPKEAVNVKRILFASLACNAQANGKILNLWVRYFPEKVYFYGALKRS